MRMTLLVVLLVVTALTWVVRPEATNAYQLGGIDYNAPVFTPQETRSKDTEWYANRYGVTLDDAARRLELGPEISKLQFKLRLHESQSFAGLWIEHTPRIELWSASLPTAMRPYDRTFKAGR